MRTILLIAHCCLLLSACRNKEKIPGHVLPREKMQAVLRDMMRADQFLADFVFSRDTSLDKKAESTRFYRTVLGIHHVSKEEFQQSFSFYRSHPVLLKVILDSIGSQQRDDPSQRYGQPAVPTGTDTTSSQKQKRPLPVE